jgi:hypothetical protein
VEEAMLLQQLAPAVAAVNAIWRVVRCSNGTVIAKSAVQAVRPAQPVAGAGWSKPLRRVPLMAVWRWQAGERPSRCPREKVRPSAPRLALLPAALPWLAQS